VLKIQLEDELRGELASLFADSGSPREDFEGFLSALMRATAIYPPDLVNTILRFRADPQAPGSLLIEGMPVDPNLPATPTLYESGYYKDSYISEGSILSVAILLGEPVGYADEKNGAIVQNIFPVKTEERNPSNESSKRELEFHTELSFSHEFPDRPYHVACPDFLLLLGLRSDVDDEAATQIVEAAAVLDRVSIEHRDVLREELFQLQAPFSFTRTGTGERPWSRPVPLLFGTHDAPTIAFDIACGVRSLSGASEAALEALRDACNDPTIHQEMRIKAGDLLVVDNRKCAHARSSFRARFDGTDRWLQRVYVRQSIIGLPTAGQNYSFRVLG
jgi:L-asparagine oxygenase